MESRKDLTSRGGCDKLRGLWKAMVILVASGLVATPARGQAKN